MGNNCSTTHNLIPICGKINKNTETSEKNENAESSEESKSKDTEEKNLRGRVVIMKKKEFTSTDTILRKVNELFDRKVSIQLVSADQPDPDNDNRGKIGKIAYPEEWTKKVTMTKKNGDIFLNISFDWDETMGLPGAFKIRNHHHTEFYIKSMTIWLVQDVGTVHFECNSWVYPAHRYENDRTFFSNKVSGLNQDMSYKEPSLKNCQLSESILKHVPQIHFPYFICPFTFATAAYLPVNTPEPLRHYRQQELTTLRGNGTGMLMEWDRVYDYAYYNDLGISDKEPGYARPVLGGSIEHPYPRRGRTGRKPTKTDPNRESRLLGSGLDIYVPRDEWFSHVKLINFQAIALRSIGQLILHDMESEFEKTENELNLFQDILQLYEDDGVRLLHEEYLYRLKGCVPWEMLRQHIRRGGGQYLKLPVPAILQEDRSAWKTDEEFAREMLAGVNPVVIRCLKEFPAVSKLDPAVYGNQNSFMIQEQVEESTNGEYLEWALKANKLFILDYHDAIMPYLRRINTTSTKTYASRTLLLLQEDGTLKPLQIELSIPFAVEDPPGSASQVFAPAREGDDGFIWKLAKGYVAVNDSGYHQLISHWLNTHAVMEPFVIATNRQLSFLHPINKLLHPHFRDTMQINAVARQQLINANGILEKTIFPAQYAMEMSSAIYKSWNFTDQALPADLLKRGMAVPDPDKPHGLRLLIEDYPYAVDGLEIWFAIESWVRSYCTFYYHNDAAVLSDTELQAWWTEIRTVGHGDLKDEPWWPTMQTQEDLIQTCTIIIWLASAQHAAINFGQYAYAGYPPNRPSLSRCFMPVPETPEYSDMRYNFAGVYLRTFTSQFKTLLGVSLINLLSQHMPDETYLGRRGSWEWTNDSGPLEEFEKFGQKLIEIERGIAERNANRRFKNRLGPAQVPYTLLYPSTSDPSTASGHSGKGIPNSVSI